MEAATSVGSALGVSGSSGFMAKVGVMASLCPNSLCFNGRSRSLNGRIRLWSSVSLPKHGDRQLFTGTQRKMCIRASSTEFSSPDPPLAPLQLESPVGQFLSQILMSHPHLLPAAVERQLEQLQTDRESEKQKEEPSTPSTDLVLYRRIAEVKANERKKVLEEILYALVVQKFVDAEILLMPTISPLGRVKSWDSSEGDDKLELLHSPEAFEMIKNHLTLILGQRATDLNSVAPISKLRVGQVYAASVMYGYFLKRVDQRFQLEKTMKTLPFGSDEGGSDTRQRMPDESFPSRGNGRVLDSHPDDSVVDNSAWSPGFGPGGIGQGIKPSRLRSYVMSFDAETLQRYATIRSKEAISIIEKHTEALFGRPEIVITPEGTVDSNKDEVIKISFGVLRRLILEAVTFGSFLWDVESYVDSRYHFVTN
ncbi:hypothetical protein QJS10_CPB12g01597 [Acorus calamus]|uniref:UV-B-induced protein At3g17800, chloroplastic n=1 Tax=Acorus calamus TaxID=4465 RepID=A0AAV9DK58_ACOCL|nr:hypothetical protein QJS10_CPB12g01597 [Acorus calamus]